MEKSPGVNLDGVNGNILKKLVVFQLVDALMKKLAPLQLQVQQTINVGCSMNLVIRTLNLVTIVLVSIIKIMLSMIVLMTNVTGTMK